MDTLLHLGLLNAALATLLALLAAAARCLRRRPALIHALWLLVLLKLLTPPFLAVPIPWLPRPESAPSPPASMMSPAGGPADEDGPNVLPESPIVAEITQPQTTDSNEKPGIYPEGMTIARDQAAAPRSGLTAQPDDSAADDANPPPTLSSAGPSWEQVVAAVWLIGSVLWWAVAGVRLVRFRTSLRNAWPASPALQQRAERLAQRLGLSGCPRVYVLPAPIMPLLWAVVGEPCLLLPAVLWARLTGEQQDTLLAHELAHLRRGGPWVRRLELVVLGLYWWHPVVWWARHEIQETEEQCCDAWVLWALPAAAETYAAALLETVAFLSRLRPALPLGASGAGHTQLLRRRLTMILKGTTPRALSWTALAALLVCGVAFLPLRPTWGQDRPRTPTDDTTPAATTPTANPAVIAQQTTPASSTKLSGTASNSDTGLTGSISAPRDIEEAKDAVELMQVQLEGKKAELLEARALVEQARRQLDRQEELRKRGAISAEEVEQLRTELTVREARLRAKEAQIKEAEVRLRQANRSLSRLQGGAQRPGSTGTSSSVGTPTSPASTSAATTQPGTGHSSALPHVPASTSSSAATTGTATSPNKDLGGDTVPKGIERSAPASDGEQRMRQLEKKLDALLKDVDALRREIRRQRTSGAN